MMAMRGKDVTARKDRFVRVHTGGARPMFISFLLADAPLPENHGIIAQLAQTARIVKDPPPIGIQRLALPDARLLKRVPSGTPVPAAKSEAVFDLNVIYTNGKLWNPAVQRFDQVKLRSYQGTGINPDAPY